MKCFSNSQQGLSSSCCILMGSPLDLLYLVVLDSSNKTHIVALLLTKSNQNFYTAMCSFQRGVNKCTNAESSGRADTKKKPCGVSLKRFYFAFMINKRKANVRSISEMFIMKNWRTTAFQRLANIPKQDQVGTKLGQLSSPLPHIHTCYSERKD